MAVDGKHLIATAHPRGCAPLPVLITPSEVFASAATTHAPLDMNMAQPSDVSRRSAEIQQRKLVCRATGCVMETSTGRYNLSLSYVYNIRQSVAATNVLTGLKSWQTPS
jgi:hypothetical protein